MTDTSSSPTPDLPDVLAFMQTLWSVVHGLDSASKRMRGTLGITGPQRLVLRVVGLCPRITAGALASVLRVHPSTLTGVLQRLDEQGLIARHADPVDRRRAVLRLTARGARLNALRRGTVESAVAAALAGVPEAERDVARGVLARVAASLAAGQRRTARAAPGRHGTTTAAPAG